MSMADHHAKLNQPKALKPPPTPPAQHAGTHMFLNTAQHLGTHTFLNTTASNAWCGDIHVPETAVSDTNTGKGNKRAGKQTCGETHVPKTTVSDAQ
jgi:hypothetical protein